MRVAEAVNVVENPASLVLELVLGHEQDTLAEDGLEDLGRHALVPARNALFLVHGGEDVDGAAMVVLVVGGSGLLAGVVDAGLEADLGKDVRVRDDGSECLGDDADQERLAHRKLGCTATLEGPGLTALEDAVSDGGIDGEDEAGAQAGPEGRDAALVDDLAGSLEERRLASSLASRAGGRDPQLLPCRDDRDRDREDLSERTGRSAQRQLGRRRERPARLLERRVAQPRVEEEVCKL